MAGTMSVPRSIQRMVIVPSGSGTSAMMKRRNGEISGMLLVSVYAIDFFRLSKIRRPANSVLLSGTSYIYVPGANTRQTTGCVLIFLIIPRSHSYCLSLTLCLEWYNGSITPRVHSAVSKRIQCRLHHRPSATVELVC